MSAEFNIFEDIDAADDAFDEPVHNPALEPVRETKQAVEPSIRLVKVTTQTIKEFIQDYPNSYVVVSARSHGLLRLDTKRGTKYEVMFVPSSRDRLERMMNKQFVF